MAAPNVMPMAGVEKPAIGVTFRADVDGGVCGDVFAMKVPRRERQRVHTGCNF